jgi:hypothetical protein
MIWSRFDLKFMGKIGSDCSVRIGMRYDGRAVSTGLSNGGQMADFLDRPTGHHYQDVSIHV